MTKQRTYSINGRPVDAEEFARAVVDAAGRYGRVTFVTYDSETGLEREVLAEVNGSVDLDVEADVSAHLLPPVLTLVQDPDRKECPSG